MSLFDELLSHLDDALVVSAHARPVDGKGAIEPGDEFVATFTIENVGASQRASTQARMAFVDVAIRIEATPFAAPLVDGEPVNDIAVSVGELIHGEAFSVEQTLRALAALDGPEPFARVTVRGHLDTTRLFAVQSAHRFSTEIHRPPATDPAILGFRQELLEGALPEGFELIAHTFDFDEESHFTQIAQDPDRFRNFVRERVAELAETRGLADQAIAAATLPIATAWVDVFETGYQASLAFALWFVGFDQGESISFDQVRTIARRYFESFEVFEDRRELRMIKGFENDGVLAAPVTVADLPVIVDHGAHTVTLWIGRLAP